MIVCQLFVWGICESLKLWTWIGTLKWFAKSLQNAEQNAACQKVANRYSLNIPIGFWSLQILVRCMILVGRIGTCLTVTASPGQLNLWREYFLYFLVICNLAISSLPTCSAGLFEALSNFNPLIIFDRVWQCLRWWPIIRAVATSVVAPGLFRESGPAMWANTVSKLSKLMLLGIPWIQRVLDERLE